MAWQCTSPDMTVKGFKSVYPMQCMRQYVVECSDEDGNVRNKHEEDEDTEW